MIGNSWDDKLKIIWESEGFKKFLDIIKNEYNTKTIFPPKNYVFEALKRTPYENVKVVIMGQDPYHGQGEAHGLSFSVQKGIKLPPSLKNIYKELESDLGVVRTHNNLSDWAHQGVLLLNAIMSVEKDRPLSHKDRGWETFTDHIIMKLNERKDPIVFVLWGSFARSKKALITNPIHKIVESAHPSPLSAHRGFFGSRPFSKVNRYLVEFGKEPINWGEQN